MAPNYGPQESPSHIITKRYFLATDFVSGVGYGAQIILYLMCAIYLWGQRKAQRSYKFMLIYMTLLLLLSTISQLGQAHRAQMVLIDNHNYHGGPWAYHQGATNDVTNLLTISANFALLFFSELLMLWRCWVVWYSVGQRIAYLVITLPGMVLLGAAATGIRFIIAAAYPKSAILVKGTFAWLGVYHGLISATNIILTCFILARLITHRREVSTSLSTGNTQDYCSLITMLVESAAMYSAISAAWLISYGLRSPVNQPLVVASITSQQISGYLIIARLAHGRSWRKDTYEKEIMMKINTMVISGSNIGGQTAPKPEGVVYR
ncbi:hypothetical protein BD779DRAFT_1469406 [Infundibulicybe gibba]|nr:hypothetical protein BD779DRAFT_1469406 [Infundibulicybe gibba]